MTSTAVTKPHSSATIALALNAVTEHAEEHQLGVQSISADVWESEVTIVIPGAALGDWLQSVHVDGVDKFRTERGSLHLHHHCRLPVGVRIDLVALYLGPGLRAFDAADEHVGAVR